MMISILVGPLSILITALRPHNNINHGTCLFIHTIFCVLIFSKIYLFKLIYKLVIFYNIKNEIIIVYCMSGSFIYSWCLTNNMIEKF